MARRAVESVVGNGHAVYTFDTERRDLKRRGYLLDLRVGDGRLVVVASRVGPDMTRRALAQIDRCWAREILLGTMSPLSVLDRRLGEPRPALVECVRMIVGGQRLHRVDSHTARRD
jgi:hypothetical protein